jgi:predicted  nucleic acid-binding Zn-ribbon protein
MIGPENSDQLDDAWSLVIIVQVDHADRIQCQCKGCGQTVFRRVHVVQFATGEIECWGSTCYQRELGSQRGKVEPLYSGVGGRRLTEQEREWLKSNRDKLIAELRAEWERERAAAAEQEARAKAEAERAAEEERLRIEETGRAFAEEREARSPSGRPYGSRLAAQPPPARFHTEPMDDPLYRAIRERLAARWAALGINIERPGQKNMFLENVRAEYKRRGGGR